MFWDSERSDPEPGLPARATSAPVLQHVRHVLDMEVEVITLTRRNRSRSIRNHGHSLGTGPIWNSTGIIHSRKWVTWRRNIKVNWSGYWMSYGEKYDGRVAASVEWAMERSMCREPF